MSDRHKAKYIPFRCSPDTDELLTRIAEGEGRTKSEVLRELVQRGLVAGGYATGQQELGQLVQNAVTTVMKPQVERLAAISAKAAQISAAAFFMEVYTNKQLVPEEIQSDIDFVADKARRLGVEYLKLSKSQDMDSFITNSNQRMANGSKPE